MGRRSEKGIERKRLSRLGRCSNIRLADLPRNSGQPQRHGSPIKVHPDLNAAIRPGHTPQLRNNSRVLRRRSIRHEEILKSGEVFQQFEVRVGGRPAALESQRLNGGSELSKVPRKGYFVEGFEVYIVHVQGSDLPERSEMGDMLFEDLRPDPPSTKLEGSDERRNVGRQRWDRRAPALKARFVPEGDVFEEDQLTSNPPRSADQRAAA